MEGEKSERQQWFPTKQAANLAKQKIEADFLNHGAKHGLLSDTERSALIAFREAVAAMPEPRPTLMDAVQAFLESIRNQILPVTVADLVSLRLESAAEKGVHSRTLRDLGGADGKGGRLGAFAEAFGKRQAATVTPEEIRAWSLNIAPTEATRREYLIRLNALFAFGVDRGFLRDNPVKKITKPRLNSTRPEILTVEQSRRLLAACSPRILPAVAVQMLAGLRTAEAERLDWADINFERGSVRVTQRKGAGGRREKSRFAPLLPLLRHLLLPFRKLSGPVFPEVLRGSRQGQASSEIYHTDRRAAADAAGLENWDENLLRHTFGSYRFAQTRNLPEVGAEMGHTVLETTVKHYVDAVDSTDAEAFWAVPEAPAGGKIIAMEATA